MNKELATPIDTSQIGKPYNQCNSEEKFERRKTAIRLAILMKLKKNNSEEQELTVDKISKIVGVPRSDLFRWLKMEENEHGAGMVGYKMGPSKEKIREKLSKEDKCKLFIILQLYFPQEFEIMYAIRCRKAVQELIYVIFGVFYSLNSISKLMMRGNFVLRRPEKFSILRDDEKIDKYEKGFEDFANLAKKAGATIVWGNEIHGQQDSTHSRGYSPKGRAARVLDFATTSSHRVFTLFIAISFCGKMIFTLETENSKAPTFIRFLRELKKHITLTWGG